MLKEILLEGAADPAPEQWGKTTEEEKLESGIGGWPGVTADTKPPNATLRLYGGAAFERVVHEFRSATYSVECPAVSREKVIFTRVNLFILLKFSSLKFHLSSFDRLRIFCLHMLAGVGVEDLQRLLQRSHALQLGHGLLLFLTLHVIGLLLFYAIFSTLPVREIAISKQDVSSTFSLCI